MSAISSRYEKENAPLLVTTKDGGTNVQNFREEMLFMNAQQLTQYEADLAIQSTLNNSKEETTMTNLTKQEIRTMIEAMDSRFTISNTAFKQIKKELLEKLYAEAKNILEIMSSDEVKGTFDAYVQLAVRGNVFPLVKANVVDLSESKCYAQRAQVGAYVLNQDQIDASIDCSRRDGNDCSTCICAEANIGASEASAIPTPTEHAKTEAVKVTESVKPKAGIKDGVLGLYVNKELVEVADLSYAQRQIDAMNEELVRLRALVKEQEEKLNVKPVQQSTPVSGSKSGRSPRYTPEQLESMKQQAINSGQSVKVDVIDGSAKAPSAHSGAYTPEQIAKMRQEANKTQYTCGCGTHVTAQNIAFLKQAKVQSKLPQEYKNKALCWHCQQSILGGGRAFTVEERKAGLHKKVRPVKIK